MAKTSHLTDIGNIPLGCPECNRLGLEQTGIFPYLIHADRVNDGKDQVTIDADGTKIEGISYMINPIDATIAVGFVCWNNHRFEWSFVRSGDGVRLGLRVLKPKDHEHSLWM